MTNELVVKQTFMNQLLALPPNEMPHILEKVKLLKDDPMPQGNLKKKLTGYKGNVYRLRVGNYRVLYTIADGIVALLGVDARKDVYRGEQLIVEPTSISAVDIPDEEVVLELEVQQQPFQAKTASTPLVRRIEKSLLQSMRIPEQFHDALQSCYTLEGLLACPVPEVLISQVFDAVTDPDYDRVLVQPDYVVGEVNNLLRYKEGDLLGFLLKMSPEQEEYVKRGLASNGPTLVKGGPGTGKSTIAIYRVQAMLSYLRKHGVAHPRILFTTYTNALTTSSRQLLETLLSKDDMQCVVVATADSIATKIVGRVSVAQSHDITAALKRAISEISQSSDPQIRKSMAETISRLPQEYLVEELLNVIAGHAITSLDAYLAMARPGRRVALNSQQRTVIWSIRNAFFLALAAKGVQVWEQVHADADKNIKEGKYTERFDAVVVDEAQDLDVPSIRMLFRLCQEPHGFFLAADINQSIYMRGFTWADVHEQLQFKGRTSVLYTNYRSTREIGEGAEQYLSAVSENYETAERRYMYSGYLPTFLTTDSSDHEIAMLVQFVRQSLQALQLSLGSCAVLCPRRDSGREIEQKLRAAGIAAEFMHSDTLDLRKNVVKIITLQSAKGLEFPIVAIAGFHGWTHAYRSTSGKNSYQEEKDETFRRTMYVGMTRAMRNLIVFVPLDATSPHLTGFSKEYWNFL